ncbi:MAG: hypothetical protein ACO1N9_08495 [Flavobacterium sp.]
MKKIIAIFVVMLAFGFSANAQQKKATKTVAKVESAKELTIEQAAQADLTKLTSVLTNLTETQKKDFYNLFEYKHRETKGLSDERKAVMAQTIDAKLKASLEPGDIQKLENNPAVLRALTH